MSILNTSIKTRNELIRIFILMIILQGLLFIMKTIGRNLFELTLFTEKMMTTTCMIILTAVLFRGIICRKLTTCFNNEKTVYIMNVVLFSIWHISYVIAPLLESELFAVFSKMTIGLVYGLILGVVRIKTHNCYSTMLLHGVLNLFSM